MVQDAHDNNVRTHEPSFRELVAELDGLRALYDAEIRAVRESMVTRFAALKELTEQSFTAAHLAVTKSEDSQRSYNSTHNDLVRKMDAQYAHMMSRSEADAKFNSLGPRFDAIELRIRELAQKSSESIGGQLLTMRLVAIGGVLVAIIGIVFAVLRG